MINKACEHCGNQMIQRAKEGAITFARRRFCSQRCNGDSRMITSPPPVMSKALKWRLRKRGFDIPKLAPGIVPAEFWTLVVKTPTCWLWQGQKNRDGYGRYNFGGKSYMAHRYAWREVGLDLSDDAILMHHCDVPACVSPSHLQIGTHRDNQLDKTGKNRQAKGEGIGSAKLTELQVRKIRAKYKPHVYTKKMLASEHGVCVDTIHKALSRVYWRHVA